MNLQECTTCGKKHKLYYLIKSNNTRALFYLCPKRKANEKPFTMFVTLRDGLKIPTYLSGSDEYKQLKESCSPDGEYSEGERQIIAAWRSVRLKPKYMASNQKAVIKNYIKGDIRW